MLKKTLVPNRYVYTSHTGAKYVFLEGLWFNDNTMSMIDPSKYAKLYEAAQNQIQLFNLTAPYKIGKVYIKEGKECTFIGEGRFTIDGELLTEAEEYKPGEKVSEIPNYFQTSYGRSNTKYFYKDGWWIEKDSSQKKAVHNPELNSEITNDALDIINQYNTDPKSAMKIGSEIDYKGTKLTYVGDAFVTDDGRRTTSDLTDKLERQAKEERDDTDSTNDSEESNDSESTNQPNQSNEPEQSPDEEQPQSTPNTGSTVVPDGYVYTSGKGKKYFKKNGKWFSSDTKQEINSSSSVPLERAAIASIEKFNQNSPVKIGQEWTSNKNKTFKYVGNGRFISDDGKLLPQGIADKVLAQLQSTEQSTDDNNSGNSDNSQEEPQNTQPENKPVQPAEPNNSNSNNSNNSNSNSSDPLQSLADQIKSNPEYPRIIVLLSRGDALSLMAADILLSGKQKEFAQMLKSLNTND